MIICIRPHDIGLSSADNLANVIHSLGFGGVQLAIAKAIKGQNGNPETLTPDVCRQISSSFAAHNVQIPILGAYFNPVHPDIHKVEAGSAKFADHLEKAHFFGARYVATETGSYNGDSWTYNPLNQTNEALNSVYCVFKPLAEKAKKTKTFLTLEGSWNHTMYCPAQLEKLIQQLDNGFVRVTVDIFNYLHPSNYEQRFDILTECIDRFEGKIAVFHIKDFNVCHDGTLEEVPLTAGIMGWQNMIPLIRKKVPDACLVFEGVRNLEQSLAWFTRLL